CLLLHGMRCGGGFFDQRGVLLGDCIHLVDCTIDLLDARSLLVAGCCDLAHDVGHTPNAVDDLVHGVARLRDLLAAFFDLVDRCANQQLDFFGGFCTAACQAAHLAGHHRKTTALFPCSCG